MKPLAILFAPGARGDFLCNLLYNNLLDLKFKSDRGNYIKLHDIHQYTDFISSNQSTYTVRIKLSKPKELIDVVLLHFKKNNDITVDKQQIDRLFVTAKQLYYENIKLDEFNYSYVIDFTDFNDVDLISDLYRDFTGKEFSNDHLQFLNYNNLLNQNFLDQCYLDEMLVKTLEILKFEIENKCLNKVRVFSFDDYLNSKNYKEFLVLNNYLNKFRAR
jgi:hypothetical protein